MTSPDMVSYASTQPCISPSFTECLRDMWCSVLQCVAVCCTVFCCSALQCVAVYSPIPPFTECLPDGIVMWNGKSVKRQIKTANQSQTANHETANQSHLAWTRVILAYIALPNMYEEIEWSRRDLLRSCNTSQHAATQWSGRDSGLFRVRCTPHSYVWREPFTRATWPLTPVSHQMHVCVCVCVPYHTKCMNVCVCVTWPSTPASHQIYSDTSHQIYSQHPHRTKSIQLCHTRHDMIYPYRTKSIHQPTSIYLGTRIYLKISYISKYHSSEKITLVYIPISITGHSSSRTT